MGPIPYILCRHHNPLSGPPYASKPHLLSSQGPVTLLPGSAGPWESQETAAAEGSGKETHAECPWGMGGAAAAGLPSDTEGT